MVLWMGINTVKVGLLTKLAVVPIYKAKRKPFSGEAAAV
jgi:hypothetical protein